MTLRCAIPRFGHARSFPAVLPTDLCVYHTATRRVVPACQAFRPSIQLVLHSWTPSVPQVPVGPGHPMPNGWRRSPPPLVRLPNAPRTACSSTRGKTLGGRNGWHPGTPPHTTPTTPHPFLPPGWTPPQHTRSTPGAQQRHPPGGFAPSPPPMDRVFSLISHRRWGVPPPSTPPLLDVHGQVQHARTGCRRRSKPWLQRCSHQHSHSALLVLDDVFPQPCWLDYPRVLPTFRWFAAGR